MTQLSVVIPVLDEETRIRARLDELMPMPGVREVIVVDGGSTDRTRSRVQERRRSGTPSISLVDAPKGRGSQLNAGARVAQGDTLLFLHADCSLPRDASWWVSETLSNPRNVGGAFKTWTIDDRPASGETAAWLHLADIRSRYTGLPYGDQALFVRRPAFDAVGGFPDQPLMEDLELSRRLRALGRIATVPARVQVSGRRFLAAPVRDTLLVNLFPLLYRAGVSPERLASLYRNVR